MKHLNHIIIRFILGIIFIAAVYFVFEFGSGLTTTINGFKRPGYIGGAIGFGVIASSAILGFIYYECNKKE